MNVKKLKGKIIEKGTNVAELAKIIGVNKSTLYRKLKNNGDDISIKEAKSMINALQLNLEEVNAIFFNQFIAYNATKEKAKN